MTAAVDKHIRWKDPPVDEIHHYSPLSPATRVHWKEPVAEGAYKYPANPVHREQDPPKPPKHRVAAPKGCLMVRKLIVGILKEHASVARLGPKAIPPPASLNPPTIMDTIYNEKIEPATSAKYPPLIALPPESDRKGFAYLYIDADLRHFEERETRSQHR